MTCSAIGLYRPEDISMCLWLPRAQQVRFETYRGFIESSRMLEVGLLPPTNRLVMSIFSNIWMSSPSDSIGEAAQELDFRLSLALWPNEEGTPCVFLREVSKSDIFSLK
jgi:hypothetical protein